MAAGGNASGLPYVVAFASSAGGISALSTVLAGFPADLPAVVLVAQHIDPARRSMLPEVLSRWSKLPVRHAWQGARIQESHVYVAPPDHHLLLNRDGTLSLTQTEPVHFVRPSADVLFESVAAAAGDRALAVVLTGTGSDGALGASAIKQRGGAVIAQDEASSEYFSMPQAAIAMGCVDETVTLDAISEAIAAFAEGRLV